ncbi:MAG: hypothetical protein ACRCYO_08085 [Bacteroidia bacterium]
MRFSKQMTQLVFRLLLAVYVLSIFKPLGPLVEDTLAHCFWEMQHIVTVHEERGHFHMHIEMAEETFDGQQQEKNQTKSVKSVFADAHTFSESFSLVLFDDSKIYLHPFVCSKQMDFPSFTLTPPPEC